MGTVSYLGNISILDAFPILALARTAISGVVTATRPDIMARLDGAIRLLANVSVRPPSIAASLQTAVKILAALQVAIAPPQINFSITACNTLIARLTLIKAALDLALNWGVYPGSVHVLVYQGKLRDMAAGVSQAVNGGVIEGVPLNADVYAPFIVVDVTDTVSLSSLKVMVRNP